MAGNEICYTIIGRKLGPFWVGWLAKKASGEKTSVKFSGLWALKREERWKDVLGFYHTHPGCPCISSCDLKTIDAWVTCFWKDLLCVIEGPLEDRAYVFHPIEGATRATMSAALTAQIGRIIFGVSL